MKKQKKSCPTKVPHSAQPSSLGTTPVAVLQHSCSRHGSYVCLQLPPPLPTHHVARPPLGPWLATPARCSAGGTFRTLRRSRQAPGPKPHHHEQQRCRRGTMDQLKRASTPLLFIRHCRPLSCMHVFECTSRAYNQPASRWRCPVEQNRP